MLYDYNPDSLTVTGRVPLDGMRGAIGRRVEAGHAIPNTTLSTSYDQTAVTELQARLVREWRKHHVRPQYMDFLIKALGDALAEHPAANSHLVDGSVYLIKEINVGVAVAAKGGLIVPVVRDANSKGLREIAAEVRDMVRDIKRGRMASNNTARGTITVSSLLGYGIEAFTPIINPPETNILGVGRSQQLPRFVDGKVEPRWIGHLSLTFDHRAWDGAPAARFLGAIVERLQSPESLI